MAVPWADNAPLVDAVAGGAFAVAAGRVATALAPLEAIVLVKGPVKPLPPAARRGNALHQRKKIILRPAS